MKKENYEKLLIEYYTENHSFIEKGIFTVTASAITFLLTNVEHINEGVYLLYACCLILFIVTLFCQLYSAYVSREGCDKALDSSLAAEANRIFAQSRLLNNAFIILFCLSILLTSVTIPINAYMNKSTDSYKYENVISTPDYKYSERKSYTMKKFTVKNGFIPSKASKNFAQDGYIPPKSMNIDEGLVPPNSVQPKPAPKPKENK